MLVRRVAASIVAMGLVFTGQAPADPPRTGIRSVTAITQVHTYGQKVAAVAVEYPAVVDPRTLDLGTFTVTDSVYNFRYDPIEDLAKRADRTVTRIYTNSSPSPRPNGRPGRFVIVELAATDPGGNTVIVSKCPTFLCSVKVNPDQPVAVTQNEDIRVWHGKVVGPSAGHGPTRTVNLLVDEFTLDTYTEGSTPLPHAYHLPRHYNPRREYPLVVILPGHGMGWDGDNLGVQLAADIPATAWLGPQWSRQDFIVLAPQNQRVGAPQEAADMVALVRSFMATHSVDPDRVYASTVSYGSRLAWEAMAAQPGLFTAALITGGFPVSAEQAARIATGRTPVWVTHGLNDHLLPVAYGRDSTALLRNAYVAAGASPEEAANLVRYTEFGNEAFTEPDYHAAFGPTYENQSILRWLVARRH